MTELSPREIVSELDRFIIGQGDAKRAVAIALRNRWRRRQLAAEQQEEIQPRNILMIGPTGVGKTEISRRLAKLAGAPFLKVEATKFTEVGYVGRDVDSIIRDLVEIAIGMEREKSRAAVRPQAEAAAEERVVTALVGASASEQTRESFRRKLRDGLLDDREIEIDVAETGAALPMMEVPGQPGMGVAGGNMADLLGKMFGRQTRRRKVKVCDSHAVLLADEADKLLDEEQITRAAVDSVEQTGIVFIDEIDKVATRAEARGADVSREGVQRDLLPLIEGATVATKHGPVKTDHILFIASGAFHVAKPSDLLPELQGRLPIRVELQPLSEDDFIRILTEPQNSLTGQAVALLSTEGVAVSFTDDGVAALAHAAAEMNQAVENIGARRLHTILERVLAELSFSAPDLMGDAQSVVIDKAYVEDALSQLTRNVDLRRYIL